MHVVTTVVNMKKIPPLSSFLKLVNQHVLLLQFGLFSCKQSHLLLDSSQSFGLLGGALAVVQVLQLQLCCLLCNFSLLTTEFYKQIKLLFCWVL